MEDRKSNEFPFLLGFCDKENVSALSADIERLMMPERKTELSVTKKGKGEKDVL